MSRKPLVAVTWLDAHGSATAELEEHELPSEPAQYTTFGLLVKECPAGIVVAAEVSAQRAYRGWTFIPTAMVVEIKHLEKQRERSLRQRRDKQRGATPVRPDPAHRDPPGSETDG